MVGVSFGQERETELQYQRIKENLEFFKYTTLRTQLTNYVNINQERDSVNSQAPRSRRIPL